MGKRKNLKNRYLICQVNNNKEAAVVTADVAVEEEEAVVQVAVAEEVVNRMRNGSHPPNWEDWSNTDKLRASKKSSDLPSQSKSHRLLMPLSRETTTPSRRKL